MRPKNRPKVESKKKSIVINNLKKKKAKIMADEKEKSLETQEENIENCEMKDDEGFQLPKPNKVTRLNLAKRKRHRSPIETQNPYESLSSAEENDEDTENEEETTEQRERRQSKKRRQPTESGSNNSKNKIPPIIIHGKTSEFHDKYIKFLKEIATKGFSLKYTAFNTTVYVEDYEEWKAVKEALKEQEIEFHSYSHKSDKTHGFVIKGLEGNQDIKDMKDELTNFHKIPVVEIYKMKIPEISLYLLITTNETTLRTLQRIRYVQHTRVTWDRHRRSYKITQCHRCQIWGHSTNNCKVELECL